jgi:hypothetical protein
MRRRRRLFARGLVTVALVCTLGELSVGNAYADDPAVFVSVPQVSGPSLGLLGPAARRQCGIDPPSDGTSLTLTEFGADAEPAGTDVYTHERAAVTATLDTRFCRPGVKAVVQIVDHGAPPVWPTYATPRRYNRCFDCWSRTAHAQQWVQYVGFDANGARPPSLVTVRAEGWVWEWAASQWTPFGCKEYVFLVEGATGKWTSYDEHDCVAGSPVAGTVPDQWVEENDG